MNYFVRRLKEPSSWGGFAVIAGAVLPLLGVSTEVTTGIVIALGGVAAFVKDPSGK